MFRQPHSGFNRVPFVQSCTLVVDGLQTTCLICNLSILGVYLHLDVPLAQHREVVLRFSLPDDGPEIVAAAAVTWVNDAAPENAAGLPRGCGFRFLHVPPADLRRIAALVAQFLASPTDLVQVGIGQPFTGRVRIPFITACTLSGRFGIRHGSTCNLSILGVYVAIDQIPALGTRGRVRFQLPGGQGDFDTSFKVTWQNPDVPNRVRALPPGCGLLFDQLSPGEEQVLVGLVGDYLQTLAS